MFPVPFLRIRKIHSSCNCTVTTASPTQHSEDWMEIYIRSSPDHQRQWNWNLSVKELSMVKNLFHLHPKSTTQTTRCQSVFVTALCMNKRENVFYRQTFFNMKVEIAQWAGRHSISAMVDYVGSHGVCRLGLSHVEPDWVSIRCQKEDWCVVPTRVSDSKNKPVVWTVTLIAWTLRAPSVSMRLRVLGIAQIESS